MLRSVASIVAALEIAAPSFQPKHEAAVHIRELAAKHEFDPFTMIAIVERESRWNPNAVNKRSGATGLGQVLPTNFRACRSEPEGQSCTAVKRGLLSWRRNLTVVAGYIRAMREHCRRVVGSALAVSWMGIYDGTDSTRGLTCNHRKVRGRWVKQSPTKMALRVLKRRAELERMVRS